MTRSLLVALLAAGFLAGCAGPDEPIPVVTPAPPAPVPVDEAVDWTAMIGSGFCAKASAVATFQFCGFSGPALTAPTTPASFEIAYEHDPDGRDLAGGDLVLEWDAASIATQGLRASAVLLEDCPDDCTVNRTLHTEVGPSPLKLPIEAWDLRQGMLVAVSIKPADLTQGVSASAGQEVRLTGTLSFVEDPDGDPEPEGPDDEDEDDEGADVRRRGG